MMGPFFDFLDDEILYGTLSRYAAAMDYQNLRHATLDWFGSNQVIATLYFPSHLEHLLAQLPSNSTYSLDEIIGQHTMLPLFSRFLPPEHLKKIKGDMQGNNGLALYMRTGTMASIVPLVTNLKLCPCCANDDVTRFGEPIWHRIHQAPGVFICVKHHVWLETTSALIRHCRTRQQYIPAKQVFGEFPIARPISDTPFYATLRFIAESTSWLLHQGCQNWDQDAIQRELWIRITPSRGSSRSAPRFRRSVFSSFVAK